MNKTEKFANIRIYREDFELLKDITLKNQTFADKFKEVIETFLEFREKDETWLSMWKPLIEARRHTRKQNEKNSNKS